MGSLWGGADRAVVLIPGVGRRRLSPPGFLSSAQERKVRERILSEEGDLTPQEFQVIRSMLDGLAADAPQAVAA